MPMKVNAFSGGQFCADMMFFPEGDAAFLAEFDEGFSFLVFVIFELKHVDNLAFGSSKINGNDVIWKLLGGIKAKLNTDDI